MKREELTKRADDIVFRCFAQGQYWGTGSGEEGILNDDYRPEQPIDRTEAVAALMAAVDQYTNQRVQEARANERQQVYYVAHDVLADIKIPRKEALKFFKQGIATIQANITNKEEQ